MILFLMASLAFGIGSDRCQVEDCVCEVREAAVTHAEQSVTVTFDENSAFLSMASRAELDRLGASGSPLYVSGYTDECGDADHNYDLSRERAAAVTSYLRYRNRRVVSVKYYGETKSARHGREDRRVIVSTRRDPISRAMDAVKADVYLIDASGSLAGRWSDISGYDFPAGSKIILSKMTNCLDGSRIDQVTPSGGTEIWYSYWHTVSRMSYGQRLMIVSDFQSNLPLTASEYRTIEELVARKGVKVHTVKY